MCHFCATVSGRPRSRRAFLRSSLAACAYAFSAPIVWPAFAQSTPIDDADLARLTGARRILVKGGSVLTMDKQVGDFAQGDVLIEDGKIKAVGRLADTPTDAVVVEAQNRIVMPGFVDTHHHFYQGILRSILVNGLLNPDYNATINGPITAAYLPPDVYAGSLISALGMIDMGTTLAVDTSQVSHTPEHTDAGIKALTESGMRVVYAYWLGQGDKMQYPQDSRRLRQRYFNSEDQLLTLALGSVLDPKIFAYARQNDLRIVSHGVDQRREPRLHELQKAGLLRAGDELIHCNDLSDTAWRLIADAGIRVSLAPPIEMTMGHGMPGIQGALDHGIRPSLSSDVDATMAQDPFTIMRTTLTLQRALVLQRARQGEKNLPPLLTARDVLEFATIEGARCAHLDHRTGSLTPGKQADLILLRTDSLSAWPINNAVGAVVNVMNPSHVETVMIDGKVKKWRGQMVGVDTARVLRLAEEARAGVLQRCGFKRDLLE
ncbi:MAG: amidohydrolase family protein [Rhizobiales bacterium]|nr:amidohydrolase family protein [Hyphomicrobiales bacterium]